MKPISVYEAEEGKPFTVEIPSATVQGLRDALDYLISLGHGPTAIVRADIEAGPVVPQALELYDTTEEKERGVLEARMTFLLV